ncbi:MAG: S8 family serine peptidase [Bacteroidetes bacterium]|nr:S8 family serine peptidase [Bacteroidota bacterium]
MKNSIALLCLLSFISTSLSAQNNYYWVKFKDKNNNSYSLSNPSQFLSQPSIDRRTIQQLSLDSTDLPITAKYVDSILPFVDELKHRLKWMNSVVVKVNTLANLDSIKQFSFVDSIGGIEFFPSRALHNKFETEEAFTVDQHITYPSKYGAAYHQINMLNADLLHQMGYTGNGITIALMDNGFHNVGTTPAFDLARNRIVNTWDYVNNEADVYNEGDHGAQTFSCIGANVSDKYIGTAPNASFILNHTEDNSAEWVMEEYNWEAAAEVSDSAGANIFTTSLGYTEFDGGIGSHAYKDLTGDKTVITHAGNMAFKKGILVLNSAGNEGASPWFRISAPADGDDVLTIGAVDSAEHVTNFSSRGPNFAGRIKPDICAQGSRSAVIDAAGFIGTNSGTSFSCPIAAGCVASLWSAFPDKKATDIRDAIMISCDNFWTPDSTHGYGIPNFYNAYLLLKTNYSEKILRIDGEMVVYPNPFNTDLNISMYNANPRDGVAHKIEIFNLLGQQILSREVYLRAATFEIVQLDIVKQLAAGEYILRIDGDKNNSYRLVKAK